jgi:chromosome segregation and condensation protein ScpB
MRLHVRARDVLLVLTEAGHPVKIKQLAERFAVSERTIKYDLELIRERLAGTNAELMSRPNRGVWLEGDEATRRLLRETVASEESSSFLSARERQNRMALLLLDQTGFITLEQLAEGVQASRNTVLSDLQKAEESWGRRGIGLERESGKGVRLTGGESEKRRLLQSVAESVMTGSDMLRIVQGLWRGFPWPKDVGNKLEPSLLGLADMDRVQAATGRIIRLWKERLDTTVSDEAAIGVLFRIAVSVRRLKNGQALPATGAEDGGRQEQEHTAEGGEAVPACQEMLLQAYGEFGLLQDMNAKRFSVESENAYVLMPLVSGEGRSDIAVTAEQRRRRMELASFVRKLVDRLAERLELPLGRDAELYEGLLTHLIRKADRRRFGVHDANPLAAEIARTYPEPFEAVKLVCGQLDSAYGFKLSDSEIAYLVMHVQAAIERERETVRFRAVVICGTGKGTARLLKTLIQNRVRHIEVAECCSVSEAENAVARTDADLAISVLPMELPVPVVKVSPLPTGEDFAAIAACLERLDPSKTEASGRRGKAGGWTPPPASPSEPSSAMPLADMLGRLDPADWPAAEQVSRELTIRGFELMQAIAGRFQANLTESAAAGLSLHVMLMVQRLAFGHPYEDMQQVLPADTPEEAEWREALAGIFGQYGLPAAEAEWRAIMRYFQPSRERGSS